MRTSLAAAVLTMAASIGSSAADPPTTMITGEAFNTDGQLAYREFHEFSDDPASRQFTVYRDAEGREFGRMEADFSIYRFAPHYRMTDDRHQTVEVVKRDGSLVEVERIVKGVTTKKTLQHSSQRELIVGPGFNEFVKANWDTLIGGDTLVCDFVIPSRMQIVAFQIRHVADDAGDGLDRFEVKVDNFLLRLIAPDLKVEYDHATRALQSYRGPSNVNDAADNTQIVVVRFPAPAATTPRPTTGGQH